MCSARSLCDAELLAGKRITPSQAFRGTLAADSIDLTVEREYIFVLTACGIEIWTRPFSQRHRSGLCLLAVRNIGVPTLGLRFLESPPLPSDHRGKRHLLLLPLQRGGAHASQRLPISLDPRLMSPAEFVVELRSSVAGKHSGVDVPSLAECMMAIIEKMRRRTDVDGDAEAGDIAALEALFPWAIESGGSAVASTATQAEIEMMACTDASCAILPIGIFEKQSDRHSMVPQLSSASRAKPAGHMSRCMVIRTPSVPTSRTYYAAPSKCGAILEMTLFATRISKRQLLSRCTAYRRAATGRLPRQQSQGSCSTRSRWRRWMWMRSWMIFALMQMKIYALGLSS